MVWGVIGIYSCRRSLASLSIVQGRWIKGLDQLGLKLEEPS
ncbi:hypothetical protein Poly59_25770 [Rubripirellula reticaptiva]|uniref:Uncharacterized protein n=1 Tax=Rubripirellula reticaptiva TaxID=2528013 RepID=A0A5C6F388_9BACT|nr:hypothetical protein Poly59_25770 [Rubripirellula reticaptiva]